MKTERRHELHTNALADWLGEQIERLRPYSRVAVGILLVIVVVLGLYTYLTTQSVAQTDKAWQRYFQAVDTLQQRGDPDPLTQLAQSSDFARTPVGYWSALSLADHHLNEGINQLFNDRAAAMQSLREAINEYTQVATQTQIPLLAERATLGIARAYESVNDLASARLAYEKLANESSGAFSAEAQQRMQDLDQDSTKRFYDWFFAATPPRAPLGGPGMPGQRPNFGSLPDEGSFTSPAADGDQLLSTPAEKKLESAGAGEEKPAAALGADAESPSGEAPSQAAPDEKQPKTDDASSDRQAPSAPRQDP